MSELPPPQEEPQLLAPTGLPWDGQARMAYVRRAVGLPCSELDKEAMRRVPQDQAVW